MRPRRHFLEALVKATSETYILVNARTKSVLATDLELAADSKTRTKGLLGRRGLPQSSVMILAPCNGIHTFFMRFTIDVVFVDRQGRVLKICRALKPWRIGFSLRAFAALEFATPGHGRRDVAAGDQLEITAK